MTYITRTKSLVVLPADQELFSEMATTVTIDDESGGEFVVVEQNGKTDTGKICITPKEWPSLRDAIERMIAECRAVDGSAP